MEGNHDRPRAVQQPDALPAGRPLLQHGVRLLGRELQQWPLFVENGITNNGEADVFFNFDRIAGVGGNVWLHPAFPSEGHRGNRDDKQIVMNGDGLLAEVPKDGHDTIPHYIKASIVTPDDWKRCKEERFRRDDPGAQGRHRAP